MELTIGELAQQAGLRTSTIRYWERIGVLPEPRRAGGRRRYGTEAFEALRLIRLAKRAGFKLGELRGWLTPAGGSRRGEWRGVLRAKQAEVKWRQRQLALSEELLQAALRCGCTDLRACLTTRLRDGRLL